MNNPTDETTDHQVDMDLVHRIVKECIAKMELECFPSTAGDWVTRGAWEGYIRSNIEKHFGIKT